MHLKEQITVEWVQQNASITLENVAYRENESGAETKDQ